MACSILVYFLITKLVTPTDAVDNPELVIGLLILAVLLCGGSLSVRHQLSESEPKPHSSLQRRQAYIVALVMCEAAAVFGIVAHFACASPYSYLFFLIGLAGQLLHFPKNET